VRNILIEDYWGEDSLSLPDMIIKYNHNNVMNFSKILNSLDIKRRNLKESRINTLLKNGFSENVINYNYKQGWHIDWQGNKHFYRSSYELDYYLILDEQRIVYETEKLRILYWDSISLKQRVAIPDIYIQEENLIVEIKSNYTYDIQNMNDKVKAYKKHGYNFKLILDKQELIKQVL
jgi:hypothetical protein